MSGEVGMGDGQFGSACITEVRQEGCQFGDFHQGLCCPGKERRESAFS